jgi:hypothetical protein
MPNSHSALDLFTKTMTEPDRLHNNGSDFFGVKNEKPLEKMSALDKFTRLPQNLRQEHNILKDSRHSVLYQGVIPLVNRTTYGQMKSSGVLPQVPTITTQINTQHQNSR